MPTQKKKSVDYSPIQNAFIKTYGRVKRQLLSDEKNKKNELEKFQKMLAEFGIKEQDKIKINEKISEKEKEIAQEEQKASQNMEKIKEKERKLDPIESQLKKTENSLLDIKNKIRKIEKNPKRLEETYKLEENSVELIKEIDDLEADRQIMDAEVSSLTKERKESIDKINRYKKELSGLNAEKEKLETFLIEKANEEKRREITDKINLLQRELSGIQKELYNIESHNKPQAKSVDNQIPGALISSRDLSQSVTISNQANLANNTAQQNNRRNSLSSSSKTMTLLSLPEENKLYDKLNKNINALKDSLPGYDHSHDENKKEHVFVSTDKKVRITVDPYKVESSLPAEKERQKDVIDIAIAIYIKTLEGGQPVTKHSLVTPPHLLLEAEKKLAIQLTKNLDQSAWANIMINDKPCNLILSVPAAAVTIVNDSKNISENSKDAKIDSDEEKSMVAALDGDEHDAKDENSLGKAKAGVTPKADEMGDDEEKRSSFGKR